MKRNAIRLAQEVLRDRRKRADGGTDEWQSTGRLINEDDSVNWGNPEVASDFFRADKEDLRRRREAERDVGGGDAPPSAPRVSEGRQMAEPRVSPPKQEVADGDAPPEPDTFRMPAQNVPVMAGATPPLSSDLDRGPLPPAMQAVANRYSPPEYKEALTDEQRQALALEQWKAAGRSGTPDNPNPAPPPAAAPAPIVQASLTTATPQQTVNDANRHPLRFAPTEGAEKPAPAAPTSAILAAIRFNESRNKPTAQNPRSSAGGLYQFLDSTWGSVLRRMDPQQYGRYNDRQLRSLKTDPRYTDLQHSAADFLLTKDIAPRLEKAGIPLTPGSAYLSWFQGPAGAVKTYTAPDNATVRQVFPKTISANSNMRFNGKSYADWTMSDLRQWADTKMAQRMQPARQPLRFGPAEGYEEGGRVGYANEGAVRDQDDPRQWLEFGGNKEGDIPTGLPLGQAAIKSNVVPVAEGIADAFKLGNQAYAGELPPDYFHTDEGIGRAFNAAATPMLGSFALSHAVGPAVNAGETMLGMSVKPKGGNWLQGSIERETKGVKSGLNPEQVKWENEHYALEAADPVRYPEQAAQANTQIQRNNTHLALDNWIDKKLNKYVQNELATPEDPIRLLAERGILHVQPESLYTTFRNVPGQTRIAESQAAKAWEDVADKSITTFPAEEYLGSGWNFTRDKQDKVRKENPWLEKLPGETPVYEVDPHRGITEYLGFDHLKDELFNATRHDSDLPANLRLTPEKLDKVSVPQAVELVAKINKWREEAAAKALSANANNEAIHLVKEYPDQGYKWVELKKPDTVSENVLNSLSQKDRDLYNRYLAQGDTPYEALQGVIGDVHPALKAALKYEGDMMGHCVGGYCNDVESGYSRIFSLRDKNGKPHVTIETGKPQHLDGIGNAINAIEPGLWEKIVKQGNHRDIWEWLEKNRPDVYQKMTQEEIIQVKGKGNMKPKDEYIPFVQDFVRARDWGKIGDSKNIDMARITKPVKIGDNLEVPPGYYTQQDVKNLLAEKGLSEQIPWDLLYSKLRHYDSDFARGGIVDDAMAVARAAGGRIGYANEGRVKEENPNDWLQFAGKNQEEIPTGVPISEESSAVLKPMGVDLPQEAKTPLITRAQILARLIKSDPETVKSIESSDVPEFGLAELANLRWNSKDKQKEDTDSDILKSLPEALRWELAGKKPYDKNVMHYDASGGTQIPDILKEQRRWLWNKRFEDLDKDTPEEMITRMLRNQYLKNARIRAADFSSLNEENSFYAPGDFSNIVDYKNTKDPETQLLRGKTMFYPNEHEGVRVDLKGLPSDPKIRDILNDADLRKEYNLSLATPKSSLLYKKSKIFREEGGRVKEDNPNDWLQFAGKNQEDIPTGVPISEESSAVLKPMGVDLPQEAKAPLVAKAQAVARLIKSDQEIAPDSESSLASFIPKNNPQRVKNFDNWFGESIVRNQDGTPKTVYHGTGSDFSIFRPSATGEFGPGIYATDLADEASEYAGTHPEGTGQNVMPVHIRMEQPFVAKDPSDFWEKFGGKTDAEAMENAKKAGYDGVIIERPYTIYDEKRKQFYPTGKNHTHYVVFDPGQIKSAIGNSGEFSLKELNINKHEGGTVDRAMNISRFGTDAVQTAVNLARQHRGRPETPRSTS